MDPSVMNMDQSRREEQLVVNQQVTETETVIITYTHTMLLINLPLVLSGIATLLLVCSTVMRLATSPWCTPRRMARTYMCLHVLAALCVVTSGVVLFYPRVNLGQGLSIRSTETLVTPTGYSYRVIGAMMLGLAALIGLTALVCTDAVSEKDEVTLVKVRVVKSQTQDSDDDILLT